jgi:hypothetical protein
MDGSVRLWECATGRLIRTIIMSANGYAVTEGNEITHAEGDVWRRLGWQVMGPNGHAEILPAEYFGALPGMR